MSPSKLPIYQIDAFAAKRFAGNPAAVVPLDVWPADDVMQRIAAENNLAETAFFVPEGDGYRIRWFTPTVEVDLCGHATLASAYVLWDLLGSTEQELLFQSKGGPLPVIRKDDLLVLDFPARPARPVTDDNEIEQLSTALGHRPVELLKANNYMAVYSSVDELRRNFVGRGCHDRLRLGRLLGRLVEPNASSPGTSPLLSARSIDFTTSRSWAAPFGTATLSIRPMNSRGTTNRITRTPSDDP